MGREERAKIFVGRHDGRAKLPNIRLFRLHQTDPLAPRCREIDRIRSTPIALDHGGKTYAENVNILPIKLLIKLEALAQNLSI
jgi:hypothetical protein